MKKLICAVIVLAVSTAQADVIHVDDDNCPGPGDGTIGDPYCSIQDAIDNAVDTDEIVVAPGTYFEAINFLSKAIWLHSSDGPEVTTIDAQQMGSVVSCESGEGVETVLDGFTITGGSGTACGLNTCGGGMFNDGSSPTVTNCTFIGNSASSRGGGMWNDRSSPTVTNCTLSGNTAFNGGGMDNHSSNPTVTNCTFSGNAADRGGGMHNRASSNPTVTNCTFSGNIAVSAFGGGGGMYNTVSSSPTVTNCEFIGNSASSDGGGMWNDRSSPTVTNCEFTGNTASQGGGMFNDDSRPTVISCVFSGNTANVFGGGMSSHDSCFTVTDCSFTGNSATVGGGMWNGFSSNPTVIGCIFSGNSADFGGGMSNVQLTSTTVTNCTFSGNTAVSDGGGIRNSAESTPTVTNCILWGNAPDEFSGGSMPDVTHSNIAGGFPGPGNIDADPLFVDPDNGDYRLQAGSPCIDAANNNALPAGVGTDHGGNPRFLEIPETPDTGLGRMPIVDMGAHESLGGGCLAVTSQEVVCHADGTTFTVNIEGLNACTGGTTQVTFTASGGAVGQDLCFTAIVNDGGFCCTTEICVTIPDCQAPVITIDFDELSNGEVVTSQFPEATFSSSAGSVNLISAQQSIAHTPPNFICTGTAHQDRAERSNSSPVGGGISCGAVTFVDFTNAVDSLTFWAIGANGGPPDPSVCPPYSGVVAEVNVFVGDVFTTTVDITGLGDPFTPLLVDLSWLSDVTRIELVNINDSYGIGWDTFSFTVNTELPGDLDGDGTVGMQDFLALLGAWGQCNDCGTPQACAADFDGDCSVGIVDLVILLGNWS